MNDNHLKAALIFVYVAILFAVVMLFSMVVGCSTVAQYVEEQIPPLIEPTIAQLDDDQCHLQYEYCTQGYCVTRIMEVTSFELTVDGDVIQCTGIYMRIDWPDGSNNQWLWPSKQSDERCEAEMERLARP